MMTAETALAPAVNERLDFEIDHSNSLLQRRDHNADPCVKFRNGSRAPVDIRLAGASRARLFNGATGTITWTAGYKPTNLGPPSLSGAEDGH
jgi:hypothetical protein